MNRERIKMNWGHLWWLLPKIRGICRDRKGIFYWVIVEQSTDRQLFTIRLIRWPGCSAFYRDAGWLAIGPEKDQGSWTLFQVQVEWDYKHQGVGTALVHAAIKLAKRAGTPQLRGEVIQRDLDASPFLLTWYTKLGFTVHMEQGKNVRWPALTAVATLQMNLDKDSAHS